MMNLDNYEKVDIEINTQADIYRAMLDGYVAEFKSEIKNDYCRYENDRFMLSDGESYAITQKQIDLGYWTLWREKPKPKWWELVSESNPYVVRGLISNTYIVLYGVVNTRHEGYEPLTDAEIDQLKRGL